MTDLEHRLEKALKAVDSRGRKEVKKLKRELEIAEEKLRKATDAVYAARHKLATAQVKVTEVELKTKIESRMKK